MQALQAPVGQVQPGGLTRHKLSPTLGTSRLPGSHGGLWRAELLTPVQQLHALRALFDGVQCALQRRLTLTRKHHPLAAPIGPVVAFMPGLLAQQDG